MDTTDPPPAKRAISESMMARLQWYESVSDTTLLRSERRRSRRLAWIEPAVTIWVPAEAGTGPHVDTTIVDVSQDGLGVLGPAPIAVGTVVALQSMAGFAVGSVTRCKPHDGAYRWGIAWENCIATCATVERLIQLAKRLEFAGK